MINREELIGTTESLTL